MKKVKPVIYFSWYKVASVAIILLLSGALLLSFQAQKNLKLKNESLVLNQSKEINKPVIEKTIEEKVVYRTKIKEVESSAMQKTLAALSKQYESLKIENLRLKKDVNQFEMQFAFLRDSVKNLEWHWARIEKSYVMEIEQLQASSQSSSLSIDIDEEALLALASEKPKQKREINFPIKD